MPTVCRRQCTDRFTLVRKRIFNDVMTSASSGEGAAIAAALDSGYVRIVDVGGRYGALLAAVLDRYPGPSGVLFDLPDVVETAHGSIDRHIADGRVEKVAGDFFEAVPHGGDAHPLKWIVHDWDDEAAIRILTNCRSAMAPTGKVLLVELLLQKTRLAPTPPAWTRRCWSSPAAGNALRASTETAPTRRQDTPTASPFSILEAKPVQDGQR